MAMLGAEGVGKAWTPQSYADGDWWGHTVSLVRPKPLDQTQSPLPLWLLQPFSLCPKAKCPCPSGSYPSSSSSRSPSAVPRLSAPEDRDSTLLTVPTCSVITCGCTCHSHETGVPRGKTQGFSQYAQCLE